MATRSKPKLDDTAVPVTLHRSFDILLRLRTECSDGEARALTVRKVKDWVALQFVGFDLGNVTVQKVHEIKIHYAVGQREADVPFAACGAGAEITEGVVITSAPAQVTCVQCRKLMTTR
jgi:hypothetical protein